MTCPALGSVTVSEDGAERVEVGVALRDAAAPDVVNLAREVEVRPGRAEEACLGRAEEVGPGRVEDVRPGLAEGVRLGPAEDVRIGRVDVVRWRGSRGGAPSLHTALSVAQAVNCSESDWLSTPLRWQ